MLLLDGELQIADFAIWMKSNPSQWKNLLGSHLVHKSLGKGRILKILLYKNCPLPSIFVRYESGPDSTYNSDIFSRNAFTQIEAPDDIREWLRSVESARRENEQRRAKEEQERQKRIKEQLEKEQIERRELEPYIELADKWNISHSIIKKSNEKILIIMKELSQQRILSESTVNWLKQENESNNSYFSEQFELKKAQYRLIAESFLLKYHYNHDLWDLISACSNLRRSGQSKFAIEVSSNAVDKPHPGSLSLFGERRVAYAALLTTRGGSLRDIDNTMEAKEHALQAIELNPQAPHPHNLLGALYYMEGDFSKGDQHFHIAAERTGNFRQREIEIQRILREGSEDIKAKIRNHILNIKPVNPNG